MAKNKPQVEFVSHGIYSKWDADDKALPQITKFTTQVEASIDVEFGFIIRIKKAKGAKLRYCIYHPDIPGDDGKPQAPFDGEIYVATNNWEFYLGDTIWAPLSDKLGCWRMTVEMDSVVIAEKSFDVFIDDVPHYSPYD